MSEATLIAKPRTEIGSRPSGRLRREGLVPAVVYGLGADNLHVVVPARELQHLLAGEAGANVLIDLQVDGGSGQLTLAREIQRDPIRGDLIHVDFVRVDVDVAVQAEVTVNLVGEPESVREGGVLDQDLFSLTVEAKPNAIPNSFEADVSELGMGETLTIADLTVPPGVTLLHEPDEVVVSVTTPSVEEAPEAEEAEAAEGEAPEGEAAEGEEGAGDAAAGGETPDDE